MIDSASTDAMTVGSNLARLVECSEARAYAELVEGASTELKERYGLAVHRIGSAHAFVAAHYGESLILNRVIGLGVAEPASIEVLEALDHLYRANDVLTYAVEVGPMVRPDGLATRLREHGFVAFKKTGMLYRRAEPIDEPSCNLRVRRAERDDAMIFASLCCRVFGFDEPCLGMLSATFESSDWQQWLAFDGDEPVAGAITHMDDGIAWVGWVGTLASHRGRGAQTALAAAQLRDAHGRHALWVTLEAAAAKGGPSQSFRN
jgi:hypothetical protein